MEKTTRRNLLKVAAASGVSAALGVATKTEARAQQSSAPDETQRHGHHDISTVGTHQPSTLAVSARRQTPPRMVATFPEATVSFGYFPADSTVDRMQVVNPGNRNGHQMIPNQVTIRAGGMVNFIIAGNHQVVVYDDGIQPRDINADLVLSPPLNALIDDPNGRIYRGMSPAAVPANFFGPGVPAAAIPAAPQDRIEAVSFPRVGVYLVICAVRSHFLGGMYGYVIVVP